MRSIKLSEKGANQVSKEKIIEKALEILEDKLLDALNCQQSICVNEPPLFKAIKDYTIEIQSALKSESGGKAVDMDNIEHAYNEDFYLCPSDECKFRVQDYQKYCEMCGQKLIWAQPPETNPQSEG